MAKPSCLHPILHSARTRYKITTWDGLMVVYLENLKWVSDVIRFRDDNSVVGQNIAQKWEQSWRHGTPVSTAYVYYITSGKYWQY